MSSLVSRIKALVPRNKFLFSVVVLAGGTALGQMIAIFASPFLTRVYSPEDFGVLAVYSSILSVLLVVAAGRYDVAVPVPNDDDTALHLVVLAVVLNVVFGGFLAFLLLAWGGQITNLFHFPGIRPYLWLLPLGLIGAGVYQALNYWAIRKKVYARVARTRLSQSVGQAVTQVGLGYLGMGPLGLILGYVVGQVAGVGTLASLAWNDRCERNSRLSTRAVAEVAKGYKRFPLYSVWASLLNTLGGQLPTLLLSALYGQGTAGLYSLSLRVIQAPFSLVGNAIAQVFFTDAREAQNGHRLSIETMYVFEKLVKLGLPVLTLVGIGASSLFAVVFGSEWREAGVYSQWLSPWLFLVFVTSPLSTLVFVLEHQRGELIFQGFLLVIRAGALVGASLLWDGSMAIALFGLVSAAAWFGYLAWIMEISGNSVRKAVAVMYRETRVMLPLLTPAIVAKVFFESNLYVVFGVAASGGLIMWHLVSGWRAEEKI